MSNLSQDEVHALMRENGHTPVADRKTPQSRLLDRVKTLNDEQRETYDYLVGGGNAFITGEGGSGKSYLAETFITYCKLHKKSILVVSPTGIGAINVGGVTCHRAFGLNIDYVDSPYESPTTDKVTEAMKAADIVLIDEIGMLRGDQFATIEFKLRTHGSRTSVSVPWGGKQIIGIGDFFQLEPVVADRIVKNGNQLRQRIINNWGGVYAFETKAWEFADFRNFVLNKSERHKGGKHITSLNMLRIGNAKGTELFNNHCVREPSNFNEYTALCFTNATANKINQTQLQALDAPIETITSEVKELVSGSIKKSDHVVDENLQICIGAKVMCTTNSKYGYVNGTTGIVVEINVDPFSSKLDENCPQYIKIRTDSGRELSVKPHVWEVLDTESSTGKVENKVIGQIANFPLRLAWAITIHKSQGQTLDKAAVMMDGVYRGHGQTYVALSRVTSIEGTVLKKPLMERDIVCQQKVRSFMSSLMDVALQFMFKGKTADVAALLKELEDLRPSDKPVDWVASQIQFAIDTIKRNRGKDQ